jgi:hypothetical protein
LRQALLNANAHSGLDHIRFSPHLDGKVIRTNNELPTITDALTMQGPSPRRASITIDALHDNGVFDIADTAAVAIFRNLTIRNGHAGDNGGGLRNAGPGTKLVNVVIRGCVAPEDGGAIYNTGNLTMKRTVVNGNSTLEDGGGVANAASGFLEMKLSKVIANHAAEDAGGIDNLGVLLVRTGTVAGNRSADEGGGLRNQGSASIDSTSIYGNMAKTGGGIFNQSGDNGLSLVTSTVAHNVATGGAGGGGIRLHSGSIGMLNVTVANNIDMSANLGGAGGISRASGVLTLINTVVAQNLNSNAALDNLSPDAVNGTTSNNFIGVRGELVLGPLQNNGGPTLTMAPLFNSPLIDTGNNNPAANVLTDQRGRPRIIDGTNDGLFVVDIGAVEAPRHSALVA